MDEVPKQLCQMFLKALLSSVQIGLNPDLAHQVIIQQGLATGMLNAAEYEEWMAQYRKHGQIRTM